MICYFDLCILLRNIHMQSVLVTLFDLKYSGGLQLPYFNEKKSTFSVSHMLNLVPLNLQF